MKKEISENPSVLVEYKTIDTLVFIEKIFFESEIEGLDRKEWVQVTSCVRNIKRHLLEIEDIHPFLYKHHVKMPLVKNNNKISIKKKELKNDKNYINNG